MAKLITGGNGLLGNAFKKAVPDSLFPTRWQLDCSKAIHIRDYIEKNERF